MTDRPILVLGATGGQGGAVAEALLDRARPVRAMVRRPDAPSARGLADRGVDVVAGSLDDRAALGVAMRGVDAVFALTTPFETGVDAEVAQGHAILAAAVEAQVPHLVFSSVASANQHTGVPHFESKAIIENELVSTGLPYTIVGPTYFFDNALGGGEQDPRGNTRSTAPTRPSPTAIGSPRPGRLRGEGIRRPERVCGTARRAGQ